MTFYDETQTEKPADLNKTTAKHKYQESWLQYVYAV